MTGQEQRVSMQEEKSHREPGLYGGGEIRGLRALVCEDEGLTQMQLARALGRAGVLVVAAAKTGDVGVELALAERPDLVLLDVDMPCMDGVQAAELILRVFRPCIIMLSAYSGEVRDRALALGVAGFVQKPVSGETLVREISRGYRQYVLSGAGAQI